LGGKGVAADKSRAAGFFKLSCDDSNAMQGFACWKLATVLLDIDYLGNYDAAMADLDKACALQEATCEAKRAYQGTGLVSAESQPTGAVGYRFGIRARDAAEVCAAKGGTVLAGSKKSPEVCSDQMVEALHTKADFGFRFCTNDLLCGITVVVDPHEAFLTSFALLKQKLVEAYGAPSQNVVKTNATCRGSLTALAACVESGRAEFSSGWTWNRNGFVGLQAASARGLLRIAIGYMSADGVREMGAPSL